MKTGKLFDKVFKENTWMYPPKKTGKQRVMSVGITIGNQTFRIDTGRDCDEDFTAAEALWLREQLAIALSNLIRNNK